ncbi:T9SS type A sorting domain-containing protein [Pontibacter chitinilyticus]|uniref:T9SS type A sorting domain-containing protein n=1 Tax=Pontibacter chitinilyticus TaxID=2674989 RepID=UPI00321BD777
MVSSLHATAWSISAGWREGSMPESSSSNVAKPAFATQQVVSFTLINADTNKDIQLLNTGSTLNLAELPTRNLNIRANTNPATVGSVSFALSGTLAKAVIENGAPYALFGDIKGNYNAWKPAVGTYTLEAIPYSASKGTGTAGTPYRISFTVVDKSEIAQEIKVNFQDPTTTPPTGWVKDYGQPFGLRSGSALTYGWKKRSDGSPLDLSVGGTTPGNGRNRGVPADVLLATLLHMQANDVISTFNGTKEEGFWEAKVVNGIYDVTVSAGDAGVYPNPESHSINVEGVRAITNFVPSGATGSLTRFKSATVRVTVTDGLLTINADGGTNTKINSARIVPVSSGPYTYWSANAQYLSIDNASTTTKTFSAELGNSAKQTSVQYNLSATYSAGGSGWLHFDATHYGSEPNVTFDYTAARSLPLGTYKATVSAAAPGFSTGTMLVQVTVSAPRPYVISSTPADKATNVSVNTSSIAANNLYVPEVAGYKGGVDNATITSSTVKLLKLGTTTTEVLGVVQGTGGGDAISFSPTFALEPNTTYKFMVTDGVKSYSGAAFIPYAATFTTGAVIESGEQPLAVEFSKVPMAGTLNKKYTSLVIGPDGKFYALRLDGTLERYTINHADGTLSGQQVISILVQKYGPRSAVGLTFDPASTATNLIAYVSHCSSGLDSAPEFDGKISRLSGANLEKEQLLITELPRSAKDHMVNSLAFGPDGALYFVQGSNSSMGSYDGTWQRNESLLSGTVLRVDMKKLSTVTLPLHVKTTTDLNVIKNAPATSMRMSDNSYNPYGSSAPLTIYASGIRNGYDLVWHTNGQLYVPANGSAAGGNTPASVAGTRRPDGTFYNGPTVPATTGVQVQNDWLFRINPLKPVGYFGHPNPMRGQYVVNRGYADNPLYPTTLQADKDYRGAAFNFELNKSPNGALEYKSDAFNGALKGKLLVCRFSGGGDIIVLEPGSMVKSPTVTSASSDDKIYNITHSQTGAGTSGLVGMSGFINPLDLVEDVTTGNLYVSEYNWNNNTTRTSQITLLRVSDASNTEGFATAFPQQIAATEVVGAKDSEVTNYTVTIANTGNGTLSVQDIEIVGADAKEFRMKGAPNAKPNKPIKIRKNSSITFNVAFNPTTKGNKKAMLQVVSHKKKQDQVIGVALNGRGIVYEEAAASLVVAAAASDSTEISNTLATTKAAILDGKGPHLLVFPNPNTAGSKIYIELERFGSKEPVTLTVHNALGQVVLAKTLRTDAQGFATTELPVASLLSSGMYVIQAEAASGTVQTKLIKE